MGHHLKVLIGLVSTARKPGEKLNLVHEFPV